MHSAHQRGVIHCDLKPANVLVDADGTPKIIDFGIARVLDTGEHDQMTVTADTRIIGTVAYMSPEQARGDRAGVDARSDVHALGLLLVELLAGKPARSFDGLSPQAALMAIANEQTGALTADARRAAGADDDLLLVAATALRTDPGERYDSASALASDLDRWLRSEPIAARPLSLGYQLSRFVRRNRGLTAALSGLCGAVVLGLAGTSIGLVRTDAARRTAMTERDAAERARAEAEAVAGFLTGAVESLVPQGSLTAAPKRTLDTIAREIERGFPGRPAVRAGLQRSIAEAMLGSGDPAGAARHGAAALDVFIEAKGSQSDEAVDSAVWLAQVVADLGETDRASALLDNVASARPGIAAGSDELALRYRGARARLASYLGQNAEAASELEAIADEADRVLGPSHWYAEQLRNDLATDLLVLGRYEDAHAASTDVYNRRLARLGAEHPATLLARLNTASALSEMGRYDEANEELEAVRLVASDVFGPGHEHTLNIGNAFSTNLESLGRYDESLEHAADTFARAEALLGPLHDTTVTAMNNRCVALMRLERFEEAEPLLVRSVELLSEARGPTHYRTLVALGNLAAALDRLGRTDESEAISLRQIEGLTTTLGTDHPSTLIARNNLGVALLKAGRYDRALPILQENLALSEAALPGHPFTEAFFRSSLARCLGEMGRCEEALPHARASLAAAEEAFPEGHPQLDRCRRNLALCTAGTSDADTVADEALP